MSEPTPKQIDEMLEKFRIPFRDGYFFPNEFLVDDDTAPLIQEALKTKLHNEGLEMRSQTYFDGIIISYVKAE